MKKFFNSNPQMRQIIVYGIIGGGSTIISAIMYLIFCGFHPMLATAIGTFCGTLFSYFGHTKYTFKKHRFSKREFFKFAVTSSIGFLINTGFVHLLINMLHMNERLPVIPMVFFTPGVTFLISKFWAFK